MIVPVECSYYAISMLGLMKIRPKQILYPAVVTNHETAQTWKNAIINGQICLWHRARHQIVKSRQENILAVRREVCNQTVENCR